MDNINIENFIKSFGEDSQIYKNYCGSYSSNEIVEFINCADDFKKEEKIPYAIYNTDFNDKPGTHWICFLKMKNEIFLFDSYGKTGFDFFINNKESNIISSFLKIDPEKPNLKNSEIQFNTGYFNTEKYIQIKNNSTKLSDTARGLFAILTGFSLVYNEPNIKINLISDQLQELNTEWCGPFVLYFLFRLFEEPDNEIISNYKEIDIDLFKTVISYNFSEGSISGQKLNSFRLKTFVENKKIKTEIKNEG